MFTALPLPGEGRRRSACCREQKLSNGKRLKCRGKLDVRDDFCRGEIYIRRNESDWCAYQENDDGSMRRRERPSLVAFSRRGIFTPFREHVTSCRSSYRSLDEKGERRGGNEIRGRGRYNGQSTGILYMQTESITSPWSSGKETVNFPNCRRRPSLISDSP